MKDKNTDVEQIEGHEEMMPENAAVYETGEDADDSGEAVDADAGYAGVSVDKAVRRDQRENAGKGKLQGLFGNWFGLLLVIICGILMYYFISRISILFFGAAYLLGLLKPVLYGAVIAYLLNPMMKYFRRVIERLTIKIKKKQSKNMRKMTEGVSIALALISGICIIAILIWLIVPQLINSIMTLANTLPGQVDLYYRKVVHWIENNPYVADRLQDAAINVTKQFDEWLNGYLLPWLQSDLLPNMNSMASRFANGVINVLGILYNLFIGCIVAIYLLKDKDTFIAQGKKIVYGTFGKKQADVVLHYGRMTNEMFSGFISGKLVDSTIIGIICFVAMSVMRLPYAMLVSVIVGVTNVIPVFGPYIGAVPSALLILLVNPMQCLYFVIMVVILQQLDGNIIGPAILGESTGLSAFWVLFSILLFGGMWGIAGMLIGVPLFAVIYRLFKDYMELRLYRKGLQVDTDGYLNLKTIRETADGERHYIHFSKKELRNSKFRRRSEEKISLTTLLEEENGK